MLMWQNWRFWQKELTIVFCFRSEMAETELLQSQDKHFPGKKKASFPGLAPQLALEWGNKAELIKKSKNLGFITAMVSKHQSVWDVIC